MLPSDIRSMQEAYRNVYEQSDFLTDDLIEEIVEELVQECVEFGYDLNESADAVEEAAILYIDEATVTYGSDTESPEQRSARAKDRLGDRKASARKAAVKGAVERVKSTAKGVTAAVGIAGSIAKDEARRAGRTASHALQKKKAEVKQGIKGLIGKGLRKAAGVAGSVAQKARKAGAAAGRAAERLGEAKDDSYLETNMKNREKNNNDAINSMRKTDAHKSMAKVAAKKFDEEVELDEDAPSRIQHGKRYSDSKRLFKKDAGPAKVINPSPKKVEEEVEQIDEISNELVGRAVNKRIQQSGAAHNAEMRDRTPQNARASARAGEKEASMKFAAARRRERMAEQSNEEVEIYDVVLEYLMTEGHADTIAEAEYIMTELDSEMVNQILETSLDPRGRPASGPMNVYRQSKPNTDPAFQAALKSHKENEAKKTPAQKKAELDAYIERQRNR